MSPILFNILLGDQVEELNREVALHTTSYPYVKQYHRLKKLKYNRERNVMKRNKKKFGIPVVLFVSREDKKIAVKGKSSDNKKDTEQRMNSNA